MLIVLKIFFKEINALLNTFTDESDQQNEFTKLQKDSTSSDDEHSIENCVSRFLDKINPLLKNRLDTKHFEMSRKFIKFVFKKAFFNGDSMLHISLKSDDLKLIDRLIQVIRKFELYDWLHQRNYNKETCIHLASAMNRAGVLNEIIRYGADVNAIDGDGNTGLHVAIMGNNDKCVSIILNTDVDAFGKKINIDLSILNDNGYTPLHLASMKKNLKIVKMLEAKAAHTKKPIFDDVEGKHGNNALHIAIESEAREVAEFLILNKYINPSTMNKSGHTALYLARVTKATELVNLMQRYTTFDDERVENEDDDGSSKDSFESQEINKPNVVIQIKMI